MTTSWVSATVRGRDSLTTVPGRVLAHRRCDAAIERHCPGTGPRQLVSRRPRKGRAVNRVHRGRIHMQSDVDWTRQDATATLQRTTMPLAPGLARSLARISDRNLRAPSGCKVEPSATPSLLSDLQRTRDPPQHSGHVRCRPALNRTSRQAQPSAKEPRSVNGAIADSGPPDAAPDLAALVLATPRSSQLRSGKCGLPGSGGRPGPRSASYPQRVSPSLRRVVAGRAMLIRAATSPDARGDASPMPAQQRIVSEVTAPVGVATDTETRSTGRERREPRPRGQDAEAASACGCLRDARAARFARDHPAWSRSVPGPLRTASRSRWSAVARRESASGRIGQAGPFHPLGHQERRGTTGRGQR